MRAALSMAPALLAAALAATILPAATPAGAGTEGAGGDGAGGQALLTGDAFEAEVTGRTLTYSQGGTVYGIEQYLPGRRVRWRFAGDECQPGRWFPRDDEICFVYDGSPEEHCWQFWREDGGLRARLAGDASGLELAQVARSDQPLSCELPGPGV